MYGTHGCVPKLFPLWLKPKIISFFIFCVLSYKFFHGVLSLYSSPFLWIYFLVTATPLFQTFLIHFHLGFVVRIVFSDILKRLVFKSLRNKSTFQAGTIDKHYHYLLNGFPGIRLSVFRHTGKGASLHWIFVEWYDLKFEVVQPIHSSGRCKWKKTTNATTPLQS